VDGLLSSSIGYFLLKNYEGCTVVEFDVILEEISEVELVVSGGGRSEADASEDEDGEGEVEEDGVRDEDLGFQDEAVV
jgi:hypothetical protein